MNTILLLNKKAGGLASAGLEYPLTALKQSGFKITEIEIKDNFLELIDQTVNPELIIAAGGDGTVSAAAAAAVRKSLPLGVIPLGTFNHFAKDLNLPLNTEEAVEVIIRGRRIMIDAGEVNGQIFVNNSSIGLYPKAVRKRNKEVNKLGINKFFALLRALSGLLGTFKSFNIEFDVEGKTLHAKVTFVFIGNNIYKLDLFNLGARESLSGGVLELYYPRTGGRFTILRFAFLALVNKLKQADDFVIMEAKNIKITSRRRVIDISADGEVLKTETPLHYRILEKQLAVIVP